MGDGLMENFVALVMTFGANGQTASTYALCSAPIGGLAAIRILAATLLNERRERVSGVRRDDTRD
jgi:hypothetical protein